jgi:hypothetical protein
MRSLLRWPPILRAFAAQGAAFLLLLAMVALVSPHRAVPIWVWPLLQAVMALGFSRYLELGSFWLLFQLLLPFALFWQMGHRVSPWVYPLLLLGMALVFGGGLMSRVPLYNSNRAAWRALLELLPEEGAMADLGAGLGGPLAFLARQRPGVFFVGVEASPLVWLIAWLRTTSVRSHCQVRFGSFWRLPLGEFRVVYAFLSPVPMSALWEKAQTEMLSGTLLISHTFEIPGVSPERIIPLSGRRDAKLLLYRIGEIHNQEP